MTAANLKNLLDSLPTRVLRKLQTLSKETGQSVAVIVEYGMGEYERKIAAHQSSDGLDKLARMRLDPKTQPIVEEVLAALRARAHAAKPERKSEGGKKGGKQRAKNLSSAERKKIAVDAVNARWAKYRKVKEDPAQ